MLFVSHEPGEPAADSAEPAKLPKPPEALRSGLCARLAWLPRRQHGGVRGRRCWWPDRGAGGGRVSWPLVLLPGFAAAGSGLEELAIGLG